MDESIKITRNQFWVLLKAYRQMRSDFYILQRDDSAREDLLRHSLKQFLRTEKFTTLSKGNLLDLCYMVNDLKPINPVQFLQRIAVQHQDEFETFEPIVHAKPKSNEQNPGPERSTTEEE